jgi:PKD repeat protein
MKQIIWLALIFSTFQAWSSEHCLLYPVSLEERVRMADLIVEAEVVHDSVFAIQSPYMIRTAYTLRIIGVLKGMTMENTKMIVDGGVLGDRALIVRPSVNTAIGSRGVFLLRRFGNHHEPFAGPQSMILLDDVGKAHEPFRIYPTLLDAIERIVALTGLPYRHQPQVNQNQKGEDLLAASITSITPTISTAGRGSVLTINGSGFGASRTGNAKVEFKNGNDGGATWTAPSGSQYVSWSDVEIKVLIPTLAGTGQIRVTAADNSTAVSGQTLTIDYSLLNTSLNRIWLRGQNGNGGHTFIFNNAFGTNPTEAFKRALQSWRCNTFVNIGLSANTTPIDQFGKDNVNVVTFNNNLPAGTLGVTYNWYAGCASNQWFSDEFDMLFVPSAGAGWNFGPGATTGNRYDFETVALHELGHAIQLGHVINNNYIMHYALGPNTDKRVLNAMSDIAGGNDVVTFSTATKPCGPAIMQALNANNCQLIAPPIAAFSASPNTGCTPLQVQFTDQSLNGPTSFAWDIDNNGTTDYTTQNPSHVYANPGIYSVRLTVTSGSGSNSLTTTNMITVNQSPIAQGRGLITPCQGTQQVMGPTNAPTGGMPPYTYSWSPITGLSNPNALNPTLTIDFTAQRNYALTITDQRGCSVITRDTINPNPALIVSAGADQSECIGAIVTLGGQPTAVGGTPPYTYSWSPTNLVSSSIIPNPTAVIRQSQMFICTVTDARGCVQRDTVMISTYPDLTVNAGSDKIICMNARDTLGGKPSAQGGTPPYQFQWLPSTGLSSGTIANPIINNPQTRAYILQVTDAMGCVKRDTMQVSAIIPVKPTIRIVSGKQILCAGDSIVLEAMGDLATFRWKDGSTKKSITIRAKDTVFVDGITASGCSMRSDSIIIQSIPAPSMQILGNAVRCPGELITLRSPSVAQFTQTWNVIGGEIIGPNDRDSLIVRVNQQGLITLERKQGQCIYSVSDTLRVHARISPIISVIGKQQSCIGDTVVLRVDGSFRAVKWSDGVQGIRNITQSGTYWADIEDDKGCMWRSDTVNITFNALPAKPIISLQGDSLITASAIAYQWYTDKGEINGARNQWFRPDSSGFYRVRIWNKEECSEISDPFSYIRVTALPREKEQSSRILHQPADAELRIEHPYFKPQISIVNMLGNIVMSGIADSPIHIMSVGHLPSGYYTIVINQEILPLLILH